MKEINKKNKEKFKPKIDIKKERKEFKKIKQHHRQKSQKTFSNLDINSDAKIILVNDKKIVEKQLINFNDNIDALKVLRILK